MPSFSDWLGASWADFRRRWAVLLAVTGLGGAATLATGFFPLALALLATLTSAGHPWAVWGTAGCISLIAVLWFSTWVQAATILAAMTDQTIGQCLRAAWGQTAAFSWVLCLVLIANVGGLIFFIIPGLVLFVMLFAAPFYQISGEAQGLRALGLSWARVGPRFTVVATRLMTVIVVTAVPGWIPWIGWIIAPIWAPFGVIALARLANDLRAAEPETQLPHWWP